MSVRQEKGGFAALFVVVVLGGAALLMAVNANYTSLGELASSYVSARGEEARALAEGCIDETLRRILIDTAYGLGSGPIAFSPPNGSCIITVDGSGSARTITVLGNRESYYKKVQVSILLPATPVDALTVVGWDERSD